MNVFTAALAAALVVAWAVLVIVAQQLNPDQSPLSMGMSGLARGHCPWVMKSAFLCRGGAALMLLIALPAVVGVAGLTLSGVLAFWVWGVASAALALIDTDMPGEPPSQMGAVHITVAMLAYVCGVVGAVVLSVVVLRMHALGGASVLALLLALAAAVAMVVQFVAFGVAAGEARTAAEGAALAAAAGVATTAVTPDAAAPPAGVPPQLTAAGQTPPGARSGRAPTVRRGPGDRARDPLAVFGALAPYAGLLQRVFVGLLMAWTLLVAVGVVRSY